MTIAELRKAIEGMDDGAIVLVMNGDGCLDHRLKIEPASNHYCPECGWQRPGDGEPAPVASFATVEIVSES